MKKLVASLGLALGLVGMTALPALAWHLINGSAQAVCQQDGTYLVTFSAESWDSSHPANITWTGPNPGTFPGTATSASNTANATWSDSEETASLTVSTELGGDCKPPVTCEQTEQGCGTPTPPPPTCDTTPELCPSPTPSPTPTPTPVPTPTPTPKPPHKPWHSTWTPKPPVPPAQSGTAFTGADITAPLIFLGVFLLLGALALTARRRKV